MPKKYENDINRITDRVVVDDNDCWIWQGSKDNHGYGMAVGYKHAKIDKAHRVSYRMFVEEIPAGKSICHTCDVRACVNPDHLYCGTARDNARDAKERGRQNHTSKRLTAEQKKQMALLHTEGITKQEIAETFGVSQMTVQKHWNTQDAK